MYKIGFGETSVAFIVVGVQQFVIFVAKICKILKDRIGIVTTAPEFVGVNIQDKRFSFSELVFQRRRSGLIGDKKAAEASQLREILRNGGKIPIAQIYAWKCRIRFANSVIL